MHADILIVGQGLAGTVLAWKLEQAGLAFAVIDAGHEQAASRAAAGIINPITGRRLVKSWRVDELLPLARDTYREMEQALGVSLWREMRVRRLFRDDRERRIFAEKHARGELAPFAGAADDAGFWISPAARVDVPALLTAARQRWLKQGVLREARMDWTRMGREHALIIDGTGAALRHGLFADVKFAVSKGETMQVGVSGLTPDVILNDGRWLLPTGGDTAWVGATHEPGVENSTPTTEARAALLSSAQTLAGREVAVQRQLAGLRLSAPDKHPVAGRHPENSRLGICGALGAKGALYAPWLAQQWVAHLKTAAEFDPAVAVTRLDLQAPRMA